MEKIIEYLKSNKSGVASVLKKQNVYVFNETELIDLIKQLTLPVVSNRISDSGLRELYRKGYNDGFDNKTDNKLATDLIDKRIDRIKKNYGC